MHDEITPPTAPQTQAPTPDVARNVPTADVDEVLLILNQAIPTLSAAHGACEDAAADILETLFDLESALERLDVNGSPPETSDQHSD